MRYFDIGAAGTHLSSDSHLPADSIVKRFAHLAVSSSTSLSGMNTTTVVLPKLTVTQKPLEGRTPDCIVKHKSFRYEYS
jgi:hypothetical protein